VPVAAHGCRTGPSAAVTVHALGGTESVAQRPVSALTRSALVRAHVALQLPPY
jgi:hypothetical protein